MAKKKQVTPPEPPALSGALAAKFCEQCHWAYETWQTAMVLWEPKTIKATQQSPFGHYWYRVQEVLRDYYLLAIAKLHDPAVIQGKITLTLEYVLEYGGWDKGTKKKLRGLKNQLDELFDLIKPARNRILAHNDLQAVIENTRLGKYPKGKDSKYFENLKVFVRIIHEKCTGRPYKFAELGKTDAEAFISQLPQRLGGRGVSS